MANPPVPDLRAPSEVIKAIQEKGADVRNAAAELTKRIEQFQEFLGSLPGRVETTFFGFHPDATAHDEHLFNLVLCLKRAGKDWVIQWGSFHEQFEDGDDIERGLAPLTEAPLRIKMAAIRQFPEMLGEIEKSQGKLVEDMKRTTSQFDDFMRSVTDGKVMEQTKVVGGSVSRTRGDTKSEHTRTDYITVQQAAPIARAISKKEGK